MSLKKVAIIGASGAIGSAFVDLLSRDNSLEKIYAISRSRTNFQNEVVENIQIDFDNQETIKNAAEKTEGDLDLVLVATGFLHDNKIGPEKSIKELSADKFQKLYLINTIYPAILGKYFIPKLSKKDRSIFAAISARVGSISDNRLGGWYSYRASKAALNMIIKNFSIEVARTRKNQIIVGLHPGTVDSGLSKPFQSAVDEGKLFKPEKSAEYLLAVLESLSPKDSGNCYAWDGMEILP